MPAGEPLPIVLVHGAWSDSRVWRKVAPLLAAAGHAVRTPDLPGCGANLRPYATITLDSYVDEVADAVNRLTGRVLLVGHSLAGLALSQVAERMPERLAGLVYVSAFMLRDGESRLSVAHLDPGSAALRERTEIEGGLLAFSPDGFARAFGDGLAAEEIAALAARIPPQPVAPLEAPLRLSEAAYGRVPRFFIKCLEDRAITPAFQDRMIRASPVRRVYELPAGHSPALSHARELAARIEEIAAQLGAA